LLCSDGSTCAATLRGEGEPGGGGGRGGDDPEVVKRVLQKAEITIRMALVTSYVATMGALVSMRDHPGMPKGLTDSGRMVGLHSLPGVRLIIWTHTG
jgi:hypothetical protein